MSKMTNFICDFPEDVSTHIFLKLPPKSLITCTCVCKSWNSFIKSPDFFSSHLKRAIASYEENGSHLCLLQRCTLPVETGRDSFFLHSKDRDFSVRESIHFPYKDEYGFQVVASCNGLICLMKGRNHSRSRRISLNLWNPFIRKSVILEYRSLNALEAVGLGFDSRTSDYKLVKIQEELGPEITLKVEIYSLKTNSWKRIPDVEANYDDKSMTYLNGALYFVASREKPSSLILGLDLSEEVFHEIMLPDCMTDTYTEFCFVIEGSERFYLFTWGESLAVLWIRKTVMEIWLMKEIGVKESWTQLSTIRVRAKPSSFTGLVLTKDARVLLSFGSYYRDEIGRLFLHDLKSQETVEIANDRKDTFMYLGDYVKSLALLDKGNDFSTHFEVDSGDTAAADDDDTSRTSSSRNADLFLGAFASTYPTSSWIFPDVLNENNVPLNEGNADVATSSISHATDEFSGDESDTSNGLSTSGV